MCIYIYIYVYMFYFVVLFRFARMENWIEYLEYMYPRSSRENQLNHQLYEAKCGHDFDCMMKSPVGLCELYEYACTYRGFHI